MGNPRDLAVNTFHLRATYHKRSIYSQWCSFLVFVLEKKSWQYQNKSTSSFQGSLFYVKSTMELYQWGRSTKCTKSICYNFSLVSTSQKALHFSNVCSNYDMHYIECKCGTIFDDQIWLSHFNCNCAQIVVTCCLIRSSKSNVYCFFILILIEEFKFHILWQSSTLQFPLKRNAIVDSLSCSLLYYMDNNSTLQMMSAVHHKEVTRKNAEPPNMGSVSILESTKHVQCHALFPPLPFRLSSHQAPQGRLKWQPWDSRLTSVYISILPNSYSKNL